MSIKHIFNGYYRSGTTLIWDILKQSNPNYLVFYEPLHPNLIKNIINYKNKNNQIDNLHGKKLWSEYINQGLNFIDKLEKNKIFTDEIFPNDLHELLLYLDVYNDLKEKNILQTNRLHFYLNDIIEYYGIKSFHIIRNPIDVYNSLMRLYKNNKNFKTVIYRILFYLKNGYTAKSKSFLVNKNIDFIFKKYDMPNYWNQNEKKLNILREPIETHILSWVLCNFILLKENKSIDIILYEKLVSNTNEVKSLVEENTNLKFNIENVKKTNISMNIYKEKRLLQIINSLGLTEEYNYILKRIDLG